MIDVQELVKIILVLVAAYLLGSTPTALLVSRAVAGVDIREIGDGNMGARNTTRTLGWGPGILVGVTDFSKGALAVLLARVFDLGTGWQLLAGVCAVIGHDFPIYEGFRGGQGMAAILGTLFVFMPAATLGGLSVFGVSYLVLRNFDVCAAMGLGTLAYLAWRLDQPGELIGYTVVLFLSIPGKKALDWPRRRRIKAAQASKEVEEEVSSLDHS